VAGGVWMATRDSVRPGPRWIGPMPAQPASDGSGPKADQPTMPGASGSKHRAPVRRTTTTAGGHRQVGTRSPGMITGAGEHTAPRQNNRLIKDVISRCRSRSGWSQRRGSGDVPGGGLRASRGGPPHQAARSRRSQSLRALTAAFVTNGSHRRRGVELRALPRDHEISKQTRGGKQDVRVVPQARETTSLRGVPEPKTVRSCERSSS
jgi:hypothetical protein